MTADQNDNPDVDLPADHEEVIEIAGAETEEEEALAVAQARLIGDL